MRWVVVFLPAAWYKTSVLINNYRALLDGAGKSKGSGCADRLPCLNGQFEFLLCLQTNMMASYAMMLARISVGYSIGSSRSRI